MKMVYSNTYIHQSLKLNYGKKHLNMFYLTYLYPCINVLQIQYFYLETYCIRRHVRGPSQSDPTYSTCLTLFLAFML